MKLKYNFKYFILFLTLIIAVCINSDFVYAKKQQSELVTINKKQDIAVVFNFDLQVVDITFISPSGEKKTASDADVEYYAAESWSSYRIKDAKKGTWSIEYDLGNNSKIEYSIIDENIGLWVQYLKLTGINTNSATLSFEADYESEDINYEYEIHAISTTDSEISRKVYEGSAQANKEENVEVDITGLSSDNYIFRIDVFYYNGDVEVFDSSESEAFEYANPNEPAMIENYKIFISADECICKLDWSEYVNYSCEKYSVIAKADGEVIYKNDLDNQSTSAEILFSAKTKEIIIQVGYVNNGILSKYNTKTINLQENNLTNISGDVTNSSQVMLSYSVKNESPLYVSVNEEEGNYRIKDKGELSFNLVEGDNHVYAELEVDELVYYVIDTDVFCDVNPPDIILYDNIDGKTFYSDKVTILGKVSGGNTLIISEKECKIEKDGTFSYEKSLSMGENVVEIEAIDSNGNTTSRVITLYKATKLMDSTNIKGGWKHFIPLIISFSASIVIIILSIIFMKKRTKNNNEAYEDNEKATKKSMKISIFPIIIWDMIVLVLDSLSFWQFITRYRVCNSIKFLEMAEKSATYAAKYLNAKRMFGIASASGLIIFAVSVFITVLIVKYNKKKQTSQ